MVGVPVVFARPVVLGVVPRTVPTTGGPIVVEGRNLGWNPAHMAVMSRSIHALAGCVYVENHTRIRCDFPASTAATDARPEYLISVTLGTTVAQDDGVFVRYTPPALESAVSTTDGATMVVTGTNLGVRTPTSTFKLHVSATDVVRCHIRALAHTRATLSCGRAGVGRTAWLLTATLGGQECTAAARVVFETPVVRAVQPAALATTGDTLVVHGAHFGVGAPCTAFVGSRACANCTSVNDSVVTCATPPVVRDLARQHASLLLEIGGVSLFVPAAVTWAAAAADAPHASVYDTVVRVWTAVLVVLTLVLAALVDVLVVALARRHRRRQAAFFQTTAVQAIHGNASGSSASAGSGNSADGIELAAHPAQRRAPRTKLAAALARTPSRSGPTEARRSVAARSHSRRLTPSAGTLSGVSPAPTPPRSQEALRATFRNTLVLLPGKKDATAVSCSSTSTTAPDLSSSALNDTGTPTTTTNTTSGTGTGAGAGTLAALDAYDPGNAKVCFPEQFSLQVSRERMDFDLGGRQAPVLVPMRQVLRLTNPHGFKQYFQLYLPRSARFSLHARPQRGVVAPGASVGVAVTMTCKCTSAFDVDFIVIACPGGRREWENRAVEHFAVCINVCLESQLTTLLDSDELDLVTPAIGNGSFGVVYRGGWRGQTVAVKVLKNQDRLLADSAARRGFLNEVATLEKLRHPAIITFVGAVRLPGHYSIVTEYCAYGNLWTALQQHAPAFSYALKLKALLNCAQGMTFLHTSGILHRDLKPENLLMVSLLAETPVVCKLTDFGTTRDVSTTHERAWRRRLTQGVGTPTFMAPEVLDHGEYTQSADVYSFAMLAFQVYLARDPYDTAHFKSPYDVAAFVTAGKRLPIPPDCPRDLADLVARGWAQDPAARPLFIDIKEALEVMFDNALAGVTPVAGTPAAGTTTTTIGSKKDKTKKKKEKKDKKAKKERRHKAEDGDDGDGDCKEQSDEIVHSVSSVSLLQASPVPDDDQSPAF